MINQTDSVKHQYSSDKNLFARINLHAKHSTNKQGFFPWLFGQYHFAENDIILELGCGNATQWKEKTATLPPGSKLTLSDFSEGMLQAAKENLPPAPNISFQQIDIQNIPYPNSTFDTVIANHMLYHVPDIGSALSEVSRVLKTGGKFYATTTTSGGIRQYLHNVMQKLDLDTGAFSQEIPFNMENGSKILARHFPQVKRHDYLDSLAITHTKDLMDWLESSISMTGHDAETSKILHDYFENIRLTQGAINIPKEACLFICIK